LATKESVFSSIFFWATL